MESPITQAEIMQVALDKYMGSPEQWCKGALAKDKDGGAVSADSALAASHCAEGAIKAAVIDLRVSASTAWRVPSMAFCRPVLKGVEKVLVEQHPEMVETFLEKGQDGSDFQSGGMLPLFNDGFSYLDDNLDSHVIYGVGYQGIRAAFEKYLAVCEEKGL